VIILLCFQHTTDLSSIDLRAFPSQWFRGSTVSNQIFGCLPPMDSFGNLKLWT